MQEFHAGAPTPAPAAVGSDQQSSAEVILLYALFQIPRR